ncbi:Glycerophosphoryl diester phosphodiesterase [Frondihabitans sp. 762G35]|uniref:glycerophosphodiester phosphodiesterase family protein n=1 Tax=Frondihabitans sp. 762G35 TaxID=1446794 RepID=UPI000D20D591|nr:glycerophosphodiester phosphodiesterase family protein [Frondihabitans sp. 762G35]ARC56809.1 Glycerophosphoryl diester phosphodiesterase [Frondihabitans sp. 762G35]
MITRWFTPGPPRVLAHRGLTRGDDGQTAPENTLLAFLFALDRGATHIETDVHVTRDGVAVLSHDPDFRRTTGDSTALHDVYHRELHRYPLGAGQEVPSLAEALHTFPEARFNIDLKVDGAVAPAVAAIRREGAVDRVLLTSFDDRRRRRAAAELPGVATSPGSSGVVRAALASRLPSGRLGRALFSTGPLRGISALQVPERHRGVVIVTPGLIDLAHENGVEVHVWTVDEPAYMVRLLDLGVDGLITDRADLALDVVKRRAADAL